ncbi:SCO family protein [Thioalkalicoccus limnaeus]|uniref:SCO family protein n=1 Tax=Thioalkalicoccus limnaeus TaxID=120681 RepID=A0ABV4BHQ5_9GAMM
MSARTAIGIALAGCLVTALLWQRTAGFSAFTYETWRQVEVAREAVPVSDWRLQDAQGDFVRLSDWSDQTLLVGFIFTRCPTVCVALGSRYQQLQRTLQVGTSTDVHLLSVSIDPDWDTPPRLDAYQRRYDGLQASWTVARPADAQVLDDIIRETGLRVIPDGLGGFAHSESLHWIRDGRLLRISDWRDPELETMITNGG